jgi:chemotaxis protein methyltransferase CheR
VFPPPRAHSLDEAIRRAGEASGHDDVAALAASVERGDARTLHALASAATVGETYFFRDRTVWEALRSELLPRAAARRDGQRVRLWSAGCSSGEEAWTLAIVARETLGEGTFDVLGTDLSADQIGRARRGVYRPWSFRDVAPELVDRWFRQEASGLAVRDDLRGDVRFEVANLLEPGPRDVDVVLCRNVLIYFDPPAIAAAHAHLARALAPGGCLVLGPVDPSPSPQIGLRPPAGRLPVYVRDDAWAAAPPLAASAPPPPASMAPRRSVRRTAARRPAVPDGPAALVAAPAASPAASCARRGPRLDDGRADDGGLERARELADAGRLAEARAQLDDLLGGDDRRAEAYVLRATIHQAEGRDAEAVLDLRRALFVDPSSPVAHALLGASLARLGHPARAERAVALALASLDPRPEGEVHAAIGRLGRTLRSRRKAR